MPTVTMRVNEKTVSGEVESRTLLVQFLREHLRLTGTHVGCDTSQCGACVVHVDGNSAKSCTILAVQADESDITTIEGLSDGHHLHPIQQTFTEYGGSQCGFCTPGIAMSMFALITKDTSVADVEEHLDGNLCRCTGYRPIWDAAKSLCRDASSVSSASTNFPSWSRKVSANRLRSY